MDFENVVRLDAKEYSSADWGKALLEHVLLRAAKGITLAAGSHDAVHVRVDFDITADREADALVISTPGEIERALLIKVPLHAAATAV